MREICLINWGLLSDASYLYGVDLEFLKDGRVSFHQEFLPIGTVIHTWLSDVNYQDRRDIPRLPLLKRGQDYCLKLNLETVKGHQPYLRLTFFNRRKEVVGHKIIKEDTAEFSLPKDCYSYKIDLINAGSQSFVFDSILLYAKEMEDHLNQSYFVLPSLDDNVKNASLKVFLLENQEGQVMPFTEYYLKKVGPSFIFGLTKLDQLAYLTDTFVDYVAKAIHKHAPEALDQGIQFIGTGPKSDRVAILLENAFEKGSSSHTDPVTFDQELTANIDQSELALEWLKELLQNNSSNATSETEQQNEDSLVEGLLAKNKLLAQFQEK